MIRNQPWVPVCTLLLCLTSSGLVTGEDLLVLKNGDRMTGEVEKIAGGDLHFDTDYAESVFIIDWSQVERIESDSNYLLQTSEGERFTGSFRTSPDDPGILIIVDDGREIRIPAVDLVALDPRDTNFIDKLGIEIDFGYSLTKANSTQTFTLRSFASFTEERWKVNGAFDTLRNLFADSPNTQRTSVGGDYRRFLGGRWFALGALSLLQSDEQELDLRSTLSGGMGAYLKRNQRWSFATAFGAAWTRENYVAVPIADSAELFGGIELDAFDVGDVGLRTTFIAYPSMTDWGRLRYDFDLDVKWEVISDLFFRVGLFQNYDSRPPSDFSGTDYGLTTSLGWSF